MHTEKIHRTVTIMKTSMRGSSEAAECCNGKRVCAGTATRLGIFHPLLRHAFRYLPADANSGQYGSRRTHEPFHACNSVFAHSSIRNAAACSTGGMRLLSEIP